MKVILNQDISNLGEEGDIKDVARGYARNFLIPKKLVMPYTREAISMLEGRRESIQQRREEKRTAATDVKTRLESEPLVIEMPAGERGRLFGSVTSANIADGLAAHGIEIEGRRIDIPEKTIKNVGTTYVRVRLYGDQEAELRVDVKSAGGVAAEAQATAKAPSAAATAEETGTSESTAPDESVDLSSDASTGEATDSFADSASDEEE